MPIRNSYLSATWATCVRECISVRAWWLEAPPGKQVQVQVHIAQCYSFKCQFKVKTMRARDGAMRSIPIFSAALSFFSRRCNLFFNMNKGPRSRRQDNIACISRFRSGSVVSRSCVWDCVFECDWIARVVLSAACLLFLYSTHILYILSWVPASIQPAGIRVSGSGRSVTVMKWQNKYSTFLLQSDEKSKLACYGLAYFWMKGTSDKLY